MKIEEYCSHCCDAIFKDDERYRLPSGTYHADCYEDKVKKLETILLTAEKASHYSEFAS